MKELEQENEEIRLRNLRRVRTEEKLHTSSEVCLENGDEVTEGGKVSSIKWNYGSRDDDDDEYAKNLITFLKKFPKSEVMAIVISNHLMDSNLMYQHILSRTLLKVDFTYRIYSCISRPHVQGQKSFSSFRGKQMKFTPLEISQNLNLFFLRMY